MSFAYLVYSSSWIKLHYPAEFACALLNAQPMGFYSPHTIVRDADPSRGRGARPVRAGVAARLHAGAAHRGGGAGRPPAAGLARRPVDPRDAGRAAVRARAQPTRCSTASTTSVPSSPFADLEDFTRRTGAPTDALEALATAGAFACFDRTPARARCGPRARCATRGPTSCPGWSPGVEAPAAAGDERGRGDRRRPLGHRAVGGPPSHRVGARASSRRGGSSPPRRCASCPTARSSTSPAWSPTASSRRPRRAWCSSTSRTRPAW